MSPELVAALDALPAAVEAACSERLAKLEAALEWAAKAAFLDHNRWRIHGDSELFAPGGCATALIALHERAGK